MPVFCNFGAPGSATNQPAEIASYWQFPGDVSNFQRPTFSGPAAGTYPLFNASNANITDTSFVRLRNIALSYSIPSEVLSKLKIRDLRIYAEAQNVFTLTNYKGLNPESQNGATSLPPLRIITTGLQITL
ncbi:TonB-dependent receptor [Flagellimonas sp. CMM7]|uniref:TonB-dependent receptor n=1 Tax=Flagellimonas sp. CMM7 TaxID=2654676 RepID=UPI0013CF6C92|nr:TonB-dependent receptor [Flagellimonas sp. CMM7]UII80287.1 TonB-dependent receptor [Flagellimonas sp. CMM7]